MIFIKVLLFNFIYKNRIAVWSSLKLYIKYLCVKKNIRKKESKKKIDLEKFYFSSLFGTEIYYKRLVLDR